MKCHYWASALGRHDMTAMMLMYEELFSVSLLPFSGTVIIQSVSKCEGEAMANNRKGKLIFFYEWVLTIDWMCSLNDPDAAEVKGTIEIPNLSEENDPHEIDVSINLNFFQFCNLSYL